MRKILSSTRTTATVFISFTLCSSNAMALDAERHAIVASQVDSFVSAVGCTESDGAHEILIADLGTDDLDVSTYIAFPVADVGCQGGTGTSAFTPVVVRVPEYRTMAAHVDMWATAEIDFVGMPSRGLVAVEALANDRVRIVGHKFADGDPNCCPSKIVDRVYRYEREGFWLPEVD
ncbi:hypothetical protein [Ruegeria sp. HKCCD6428]|uniref:hypothetical protein n=1 Tax=Ruegeria sp. HKCCD6428 TaxID=2683002 RepID=UPI0014925FB3|nr:hypothetical protein [Ruegeria sp. HKCCD6428]NOC82838.1 hypothetical protein [Ruegeria sp. HKCCD6428]